jgi:hypothetical protein
METTEIAAERTAAEVSGAGKVISIDVWREKRRAEVRARICRILRRIRRWPVAEIQAAKREALTWRGEDPDAVARLLAYLDECAQPPADLREVGK